MLRTWHIAYRHHDLMNPSSPEKIRTLGRRLRLRQGSTVLDLGCGTGGPAVLFAAAFGCSVVGVDHHEPFLDQARARADAAGVSDLVEFVAADGAEFIRDRARPVDAAVSIGAAWILGGFAATAAQLGALVHGDGHVAIGDTFRRSAASDEADGPSLSLAELVDTMAGSGLAPITVLESSADEWHNYTSLMWLSVEDWIQDNPSHSEVERFRQGRRRGADLDEHRHGWAIVAGRRTSDDSGPRLSRTWQVDDHLPLWAWHVMPAVPPVLAGSNGTFAMLRMPSMLVRGLERREPGFEQLVVWPQFSRLNGTEIHKCDHRVRAVGR